MGKSLSDLLVRNSEAYVMMLAPLYWDLFAWRADPDGRGGLTRVGGAAHFAGQLIWVSAMSLVAVLLGTALIDSVRTGLPQAIVTLSEAFVAVAGVSLYLAWSRGLLARQTGAQRGTPTLPISKRVYYYGLVVGLILISLGPGANASSGLLGWIGRSSEAWAAMVLLALYFDVIAPHRRPLARLIWYPALLLTPLVVQGGMRLFSDPESGVIAWLETTTEAFLAAVVVSAYFDGIRGRWAEHRESALSEEVVHRSRE